MKQERKKLKIKSTIIRRIIQWPLKVTKKCFEPFYRFVLLSFDRVISSYVQELILEMTLIDDHHDLRYFHETFVDSK